MVELDLEAAVQLSAAIGANTAALQQAEKRKRDLAASVSYIDEMAFSFTSLTAPALLEADKRPKTGYWWAIQRVSIAGLGATTDFVNLWRADSPAGAGAGQKALNTFQIAVAGGIANWHPGRTGLLLRARQGLAATGTFTGTQAIVSFDFIQVTDEQLPYFLL